VAAPFGAADKTAQHQNAQARNASRGQFEVHSRSPRLRALMLRCFGICPEGAEHKSPGQRPGNRDPDMTRALKGRHKGIAMFRPFRAWSRVVGAIPGRCPGLICGCPFGAADKTAQHQNAQVRDASRGQFEVHSRSPRLRVGLVSLACSAWGKNRCGLPSVLSHDTRCARVRINSAAADWREPTS
jgi:hypothetical protein